jgi:hypothetical protein
VCSFWLKVWGMKNTLYISSVHLTEMIFLTKCQAENLVKMNKWPSKWPWLNNIGHIEWIGFSQIDHYNLTFSQINHLDLTFNQINHYDLILSQMNDTHLMT